MNKREVERLAALPLSERMVLSEADTVKLAKLLLKAWNDVEIAEAEITSLCGEIASLTERIDKLEDEVHDCQCENDLR